VSLHVLRAPRLRRRPSDINDLELIAPAGKVHGKFVVVDVIVVVVVSHGKFVVLSINCLEIKTACQYLLTGRRMKQIERHNTLYLIQIINQAHFAFQRKRNRKALLQHR
jgi:hypothetical protein